MRLVGIEVEVEGLLACWANWAERGDVKARPKGRLFRYFGLKHYKNITKDSIIRIYILKGVKKCWVFQRIRGIPLNPPMAGT